MSRPDLKPDYSGKCITKISDTVRSFLDESSEKVLLIVVDSLGYENLMRISEGEEDLEKTIDSFELDKITSVFPTSTVPAMTSLDSGEPPEKHSLLEWVSYSKELNMRFYTLEFDAVDEENERKFNEKADGGLTDHRIFYQDIVQEGVPVYRILPEDITDSEFSKSEEIEEESYSNLVEAFVKTRKLIKSEEDKSFFYLYLPQFDTSSHDNGPYSDESKSLVREIFNLIKGEIVEELNDLEIVVIADHGCVEIKNTIEIEEDNELGKEIFPNLKTYYGKKILPVGGPRNMYLHIKEDAVDRVVNRLKNKLNGRASVFKTEELIEEKLFGDGDPSQRFLEMVGNVTVLPEKNTMIHFHPFLEEYEGMHGGLTEEELYVPLLSMEI